jgi:arginyl-tRNA synthetase
MIEFVSANPTGPDPRRQRLVRLLRRRSRPALARTGHVVSREYYVNDTGGQIRRLGASLLAHHKGEPVPEDGYPGEYVAELAKTYDGADDVTEAGRWAAERILGGIRSTMESIHIHYDEWFSQASIEESSAVAETVADLQAKGIVTEEDGALWFESEQFGDPRERRVLRKSNGDYTYLAGDIAYHRNKFLVRGFDRVINVWGADHHGQVASLVAGVRALGIDGDRIEVRLGQMISLTSGKMSKRAGNVVDLDDVVADIGADATRLLSLLTSIDQSVTIDLDKVRSESKESPVFYVQYAHTRISSINRVAAERGVERLPIEHVDLGLLTHERELEVLRTLSELPDIVRIAARTGRRTRSPPGSASSPTGSTASTTTAT